MLGHWFQREIGQIVAPDPNAAPRRPSGSSAADDGHYSVGEGDDGAGGLWAVLAPDPNFAPRPSSDGGGSRGGSGAVVGAGGGSAAAGGTATGDGAPGAQPGVGGGADDATTTTMVECVHCHRMTPCPTHRTSPPSSAPQSQARTAAAAAAYATPPPSILSPPTVKSTAAAAAANPTTGVTWHESTTPALTTPAATAGAASSRPATAPLTPPTESVSARVLTAARSTALALASPTAQWETRKNFFALCAAPSSKLSDKKIARMKKMLRKDGSLAVARSTDMVNLVYDGATPLHAAAWGGNLDAAEVLLEFAAGQSIQSEGGAAAADAPAGARAGDGETEDGDGAAVAVAAGTALDLPYFLDLQGRTPLHVAALRGHLPLVTLLKSAMTGNVLSTTATVPPGGGGGGDDAAAAATTNESSASGGGTADGANTGANSNGGGSLLSPPPVGPNAPTDLSGRTPLGWAVSSREPLARKHCKELEKELFSPGDGSVCGVRTPANMRGGGTPAGRRRSAGLSTGYLSAKSAGSTMSDVPSLAPESKAILGGRAGGGSPDDDGGIPDLPYGHSEMPGFRIDMEDATLGVYPLPSSSAAAAAAVAAGPSSSLSATSPADPAATARPEIDEPVGLFGVLDGHGDGGTISSFVARTLPGAITELDEWKNYGGGSDGLARMLLRACPEVDIRLRDAQRGGSGTGVSEQGGTTAVLALVGSREVVVGNVGDSRAVLVQRYVPDDVPESAVEEEGGAKKEEMGGAAAAAAAAAETVAPKEEEGGGGSSLVDEISKLSIEEEGASSSARQRQRRQDRRPLRPRPIVIAGPSGVGKGALIDMLREKFSALPRKPNVDGATENKDGSASSGGGSSNDNEEGNESLFGFSVSHTTRRPRADEVDGTHYHFCTVQDMNRGINAGEFLEYAEVHGNYYGTSISSVQSVQAAGQICILDIDAQGVRNVKAAAASGGTAVPDLYYIFVAPPSMDVLEARLRGRGTESEPDIVRRLAAAREEMNYGTGADDDGSGNFDLVLVNDNLDEAFGRLVDALVGWYPHLVAEGDDESISKKGKGGEDGKKKNQEEPTEDKDHVRPSAAEAETEASDAAAKEEVSSFAIPTSCPKIIVKALSEDHKPDLPNERARIEKAGLEVVAETFRDADAAAPKSEESDGTEGGSSSNLVTIHKIQRGPNDRMAVSRAFGDFDYKANADLGSEEQAIICTPDITVHARDPKRDLYLILACDGVWDVMSNDDVGKFVHGTAERLAKGCCGGTDVEMSELLPTVGDELLIECLRKGSRDNMSVLIVSLRSTLTTSGGDDVVGVSKVERALVFAEE